MQHDHSNVQGIIYPGLHRDLLHKNGKFAMYILFLFALCHSCACNGFVVRAVCKY